MAYIHVVRVSRQIQQFIINTYVRYLEKIETYYTVR